MKKIIDTDLAPKAIGTYSQGVEVNGTIFYSGQIGLDPKTMELKEDFRSQTQQILENIDGLLKSCELARENIVKTSIFLTDLNNFGIVNELYEEYFRQPYPARSCIEVPRLPKDSLIEIEVIATR